MYTGGTAKVKQETRGEGPVGGFFIRVVTSVKSGRENKGQMPKV